jgi:hypothetical protein
VNRTPIKTLHEKNVEDCKKWLLDNSTINFSRGLSEVLFNLDWLGPCNEEQAEHFQAKLMGDKKFVTLPA